MSGKLLQWKEGATQGSLKVEFRETDKSTTKNMSAKPQYEK